MFPTADAFKNQLNSVANQKASYERAGTLTDEQKNTLLNQLDVIESKINSETSK